MYSCHISYVVNEIIPSVIININHLFTNFEKESSLNVQIRFFHEDYHLKKKTGRKIKNKPKHR